jgi:hypothetical protein
LAINGTGLQTQCYNWSNADKNRDGEQNHVQSGFTSKMWTQDTVNKNNNDSHHKKYQGEKDGLAHLISVVIVDEGRNFSTAGTPGQRFLENVENEGLPAVYAR